MAAASTTEKQVSLRLLVDKENNRVLSAEAGKDFVDVLLSFLTLPLGTVARLVGKESNLQPFRFGSLSSLYESVASLDEKHFWIETCKEIFLNPRNSMENYCQNLELNIEDTEPTKFFICANWDCSRKKSGGFYSTFRNQRCGCGKLMNREINLDLSLTEEKKQNKGFVNETVTFTISDDLKVMPSELETSVDIVRNLRIDDMKLVDINVNVTQKEMVDLLKCSLLSKAPLTDLFLSKDQFGEQYEPEGVFTVDTFKTGTGDVPATTDDNWHMKVKLMLVKSESKILFAQAEEDFADFLLSFLTFPFGAVLRMLNGNCCTASLDNLFKSLADLHPTKHLKSEEIKNTLINPKLAPKFKLHSQILPIDEACASNYSCYSSCVDGRGERDGFLTAAGEYYTVYYDKVCAPLTLLDPKVGTSSAVGFVKRPSTYMVTDELVVTPISSISVALYLNKSKISLHDLEERVISIGVEEGLSILRASMISPSALTVGLLPFIEIEKKRNSPPSESGRKYNNVESTSATHFNFHMKGSDTSSKNGTHMDTNNPPNATLSNGTTRHRHLFYAEVV